MEKAAKFIGFRRHCLTTDGEGVTTLAAFWGCPLRCQYCLNPHSLREGTKCEELTPTQLYDKVKLDNLYFLATNGGVTFGGGEPLKIGETIVGGLGVSGGSEEQDTALAAYGKQIFEQSGGNV